MVESHAATGGVPSFRPSRPGVVWILAILAWLTGGWFISNISRYVGGHMTPTEAGWYTSTVFTGVVVIVAVVVFVLGYGWSRVLLGLAYLVDFAWPVYWRSRWYTEDMSPLAQWLPAVGAVAIIVLMYTVPSVRVWVKNLRAWREASRA